MVPYRKFFSKLLLILLGTALAFLTSILIDRLIGVYLLSQGYFKAMQPNVTEVYETAEFNAVAKISSQGIRNELVTVPKPEGVFRILAIGDSFTYGWGVNLEDSWPKVLENLLSKEKRVEVINAGVYGIDPDGAIEVCRRYNYLKPDLIILGLYSTDDLNQSAAFLERDKPSQSFKFWPNLTNPKQILVKSNYEIATGTVRISPKWRNIAELFARVHKDFFSNLDLEVQRELLAGRLNPGLILYSYTDPNYLIKMLDNNNLNIALQSVEKSFEKAKEVCANGKPMVVVFLPSAEMVSKLFFPYKVKLGFNLSEELLRLNLDSELKKISELNSFYFISLLDDFRRDQCMDCFYKYDMHLTPLGNKKVAEYLSHMIFNIIK